MIDLRGVELRSYQEAAVEAWVQGYDGRPFKGTITTVTGGGKTLIALACLSRASLTSDDLRAAVVVPSVALAEQWIQTIVDHTDIPDGRVGLLGGGKKGPGRADRLADCTVLVAVLNSAARALPEMAAGCQPLMLIVDECHRAGAPKFSRVLTTRAGFRLGLSATPDREELDEDGEPLRYDEQLVGQSLGGIVYEYSLKAAREGGWLPQYRISHHGVSLLEQEEPRYRALSRRVEEAADVLSDLGAATSRGRTNAPPRQSSADLRRAIAAYQAATSGRKDMLFRAAERERVTVEILREAVARRGADLRALLFHERVEEAERLYEVLRLVFPDLKIALEHSQLPQRERKRALADFRDGSAQVLVSVKSLIEGIDVPEADLGVSVASTSSVRQRVQSLGRVLRKSSDPNKSAEMHVLYVRKTVDDAIYGLTDWSDLTGPEANAYWEWPPLEGGPRRAPGPPRQPVPSEEQIHARADSLLTAFPCPWPGEVRGQEYSADTRGSVHNEFGSLIRNPQNVPAWIEAYRGRPGGRFRVTPGYHYVIIWERDEDSSHPLVLGRLDEPFQVAPSGPEASASAADSGPMLPGDIFIGKPDKSNGTFKLGQRSGGIIERAMRGGGKQLALTESGDDAAKLVNAQETIRLWNELGRPTSRFFVNEDWQCWYEAGGDRYFLGQVPGGFLWPTGDSEEIG